MIGFQARRRRQNQIRMTSRLVQVDIQRHKEIELRKCLIELRAVRRREHRVPGIGNQRPNLPLARRQHFFGHYCNRQLALELGQLPHTRMPPRKLADRSVATDQRDGRRRKHLPARPIKISRDEIQGIDQSLTKPAMRLRGNTHASVNDSLIRISKAVGQLPNGIRVDLRFALGDTWSDVCNGGCQRINIFGVTFVAIQTSPLLSKYDLQHRSQKKHVATGPDEMMLIDKSCSLRLARVKQHDLAASLPNLSLIHI